MTIGQLARGAGVKVSTIRYDERRQLLAAPGRGGSGYRQYGAADVARVRSIRRPQELGFSLRDIQDLLALYVSSDATCTDVRGAARMKLDDIQARIDSLPCMQQALRELGSACDGRGAIAECPIIEALETEATDDH